MDKNEYNIRAKYDGVTLLVTYNHNEYSVKGRWNVNYRLLQLCINDHTLNIKVNTDKNKYFLSYAGIRTQCFVCCSNIANLSKFILKSKGDKNILDVESPISGMVV